MCGWDYIGQTGSGQMNLRKRIAMLKGIYLAEMPHRDPRTAGPGLWALRPPVPEAVRGGLLPSRRDNATA